jgi:uncharacterized protein YbaA (DUF1428 family)
MLPTWMLPRALRRSSRKAARPASTPKRPRRVGVETLETRVVPTFNVLGGLNIDTSAAYTGHALTGSFSVAGQSFAAQSMQVDYSPANGGSISISGGASATIAGHEVDFLFGTEGHAGIVLTGNSFSTLRTFDGTLTTPSLTFGSLTLAASSLHIDYIAGQSELSITGTSAATFGSSGANNVAVTLGDNTHPGILIQHGVLQSFDLAVSGQFTLHGITFTAQSLEAQYQAANSSNHNVESIDISGGAGISLGGNSVNVTLGDHAHPGIVIDNGSLYSLDATVTGSLNLFGVSLQANDLEVVYTSTTNQVTVTGGVGFSVGDKFGAAISIDNGGVTIDTKTGAVSINTSNLAMSGSVTIGGATVAGSFALDSTGHLDSIGVSYAAGTTEGIEMGDTGLFITAVSGSVKHLRDLSHLEVDLSVTVDEGGKITIAGHDYSLVEATGSITVTPTDLKLDGDLEVGGGLLGKGTAHIDLNWGTGVYTVGVNVGMYDQSIQYNGKITIDNKGDISIDATAGVYLPADTPSAIKEAIEAFTNGSDNLGQLAVHIQIDPGDAADSFGSASILVGGSPVIGFKVDGDGHFTLIGSGAADVAKALQEIGQTAQEAGQVLKDAYGQTAQEATQLLKDANYTYDQIGTALQGAYKQTAQETAQLMKDAGYYSQVVAYALKDVYSQTAQQAAQLLQQIGYGVDDVAGALVYGYSQTAQEATQLLSDAGYTVTEVGTALKDTYRQTAQQAAQILKDAGYYSGLVATALSGAYQQTAQQAAAVLQQIGYAADDVAAALEYGYSQTAQQATQLLYDVGYTVTQIGTALKDAYGQTVQETAQLLKDAGYYSQVVAFALKDVYSQTAQQAAAVLQQIGYGVNDVAAALEYGYSQTAQQAAQVMSSLTEEVNTGFAGTISVATYSADQIGSALQTMFYKTWGETGEILSQIGYDASSIAGVLKDVYQKSASDVESFLHDALGKSEADISKALNAAGYAANQIAAALDQFGHEVATAFGL